jgi:transglutaminase-like putative cysteine protease/predicted glutamine amidotransferase
MSQLLAMCFDAAASPSIEFTAMSSAFGKPEPCGWGFAWYPPGTESAVVIKDPTSIGENAMTEVLRDWNRFRSTIFVCHIRGAAKRVTQQDTHPFSRSYAGRDWILAHNGDLTGDLSQVLPLGEFPVFEPIGKTDTEHALCWLLTEIRERRVRSLSDLGWPLLREWFSKLDALGTANFIFTDGHDLVVYHDQGGYNDLHWIRRRPPHELTRLEADKIALDLSDPFDLSRSMILFATQPLSDEPWIPLERGQMMVVRRGTVVWDSHADEKPEQAALSDPNQVIAPPPEGWSAQQTAASAQLRPAKKPVKAAVAVHQRTVRVSHETTYVYEQEVERSSHVLRLMAVDDPHQHVLSQTLQISTGGWRQDFEDVFGNRSTILEVESPYTVMRMVSESRLLITPTEPLSVNFPVRRSTFPLVWMPWQRQMIAPYLLSPELPETQLRELYNYAMSFAERQDWDLIATLIDMNLTIYKDFAYISGSTNLETTPFEVYVNRRGVCQDFANLLICLARLLDIPARYRVGYIYTGGDYENKVQSEASHAWAELYLPFIGWRGFDPTNGCMVSTDHVRVACGRSYRDATPTSGTIYKGGAGETLTVKVKVEIEDEEDLSAIP